MMSYSLKAHTRANSAKYFEHIFNLFDSDDVKNILQALKEEGIKNLMDLVGTLNEDLLALEWFDNEGAHYLSRAETRLLKSIRS